MSTQHLVEDGILPSIAEAIRTDDQRKSKLEYQEKVQSREKEFFACFKGAEDINPEAATALFRSTLLRAFKDAVCLDMLICNDHDGDDEVRTQSRALEWFISNSEDFKAVCRFAGMEDSNIFAKSVAIFESCNLVTRLESGEYRVNYSELGKKGKFEALETIH